MPKITAILGGGDWADASVDHLILPENVGVEVEAQNWREWYQDVYYRPRNGLRPKSKNPIKYITFVEWLKNLGAVEPTKDQLEEFSEP